MDGAGVPVSSPRRTSAVWTRSISVPYVAKSPARSAVCARSGIFTAGAAVSLFLSAPVAEAAPLCGVGSIVLRRLISVVPARSPAYLRLDVQLKS